MLTKQIFFDIFYKHLALRKFMLFFKDVQCSETNFLVHEFFFQFLRNDRICIQQWLTVNFGREKRNVCNFCELHSDANQ